MGGTSRILEKSQVKNIKAAVTVVLLVVAAYTLAVYPLMKF